MNFTGKRVFVTGGSGDIGQGLVRAFSMSGAKVVFTYCKNVDSARCLENEIQIFKGKAKAFQLNVCEQMQVERTVELAWSFLRNSCRSHFALAST